MADSVRLPSVSFRGHPKLVRFDDAMSWLFNQLRPDWYGPDEFIGLKYECECPGAEVTQQYIIMYERCPVELRWTRETLKKWGDWVLRRQLPGGGEAWLEAGVNRAEMLRAAWDLLEDVWRSSFSSLNPHWYVQQPPLGWNKDILNAQLQGQPDPRIIPVTEEDREIVEITDLWWGWMRRSISFSCRYGDGQLYFYRRAVIRLFEVYSVAPKSFYNPPKLPEKPQEKPQEVRSDGGGFFTDLMCILVAGWVKGKLAPQIHLPPKPPALEIRAPKQPAATPMIEPFAKEKKRRRSNAPKKSWHDTLLFVIAEDNLPPQSEPDDLRRALETREWFSTTKTDPNHCEVFIIGSDDDWATIALKTFDNVARVALAGKLKRAPPLPPGFPRES